MGFSLVVQKKGTVEYVSFRESYWNPEKKKYSSRTVKNFGRLDALIEKTKDKDILKKLQAQVEALKRKSVREKEKKIVQRVNETLAEKQGVWKFLWAAPGLINRCRV